MPKKNVGPKLSPQSTAAGCILSGFDHGPITWKFTGLPRQDAASIRNGTSGACAYEPVHAARASKLTKGIQCGSAGVKRVMSRPAAVNSAVQSAGRWRDRRFFHLRRDGAELDQAALRIQIQVDHSGVSRRRIAGGNHGNSTSMGCPIGAASRYCGLWRYQK